jgi:hypothetical protein
MKSKVLEQAELDILEESKVAKLAWFCFRSYALESEI